MALSDDNEDDDDDDEDDDDDDNDDDDEAPADAAKGPIVGDIIILNSKLDCV